MEPIRRDRLALGSYQYLRYPMDYFLDTAAELGLSSVELWAAAPELCLDILTPAELAELKRKLICRGLSVVCITPEQCTYPMNLAAENPALRSYSIENMRRAIDTAAFLEAPKVLVTAGCGYYDRPAEAAWALAQDSLLQLAEYAGSRGVLLALETLTPLSSNLLNTPAQQRRMIAAMPPGTMRPILDIGQMVYMNQRLEDYLSHGDQLCHVHLHDSHPAIHAALGDGDLPIGEYLERLEGNGYRGIYALECNDSRYRADPRAADRQSVAYLERRGLLEGK